MKKRAFKFCCALLLGLVFSVSASYDVTGVNSTTWSATGGAYSEHAVLTVPLSEGAAAALIVQNGEGEAFDFQFSYALASGALVWRDNGAEEVYSLAGDTWTCVSSSESWVYERNLKRWTLLGGDTMWTYNQDTGEWLFNRGSSEEEAWLFDQEANTWCHQTSGELFTYDFTATEDPWSDTPREIMPPLPLLQFTYARRVLTAFLSAGVLADSGRLDWTTEELEDDVIALSNGAVDMYASYGLAANQIDAHSLSEYPIADSAISISFDTSDGSFLWRSLFELNWPQEWVFDGVTWQDNQSGERWTFDIENGLWTDGNGNFWAHDSAAHQWAYNEGDAVWTYNPETGIWLHEDDEETEWQWRYSMLAGTWIQVSSHEGVPAMGLPPIMAAQEALVSSLFGAVAEDIPTAVAGGLVWEDFVYTDKNWVTRDTTNLYSLSYQPEQSRLVLQGRDEDIAAAVHFDTGNWSWLINAAGDPVPVVYDATTGHVGAAGLLEWTLDIASGLLAPALEVTSLWQGTGSPYQWIQEDAERTWTYEAARDIWTDSSSSTTWRYDESHMRWLRRSSDVDTWHVVTYGAEGAFDSDEYPPYVLALYVRTQALTASFLAKAGSFWQEPRIHLGSAPRDEDPLVQDASAFGGSLSASFFSDSSPVITYEGSIAAVLWDFDIVSSGWTWHAGATVYEYSVEDGQWTDGDGDEWLPAGNMQLKRGWKSVADDTIIWMCSPTDGSWTDEKNSARWIYEPHSRLWLNVTNGTAWFYNETSSEWLLMSGDEELIPSTYTPPTVVRQNAFISVITEGFLHEGVISFVAYGISSFDREEDGSWTGLNDTTLMKLTYVPRRDRDVLTARFNYPDHDEWLSDKIGFSWQQNGSWQWLSKVNPYRQRVYGYDAEAGCWSNIFDGDDETWTFDATLSAWRGQNSGEVWLYNPIEKQLHEHDSPKSWAYTMLGARWQKEGSVDELLYDPIVDMWFNAGSGSPVTQGVPPRFLGQFVLQKYLWLKFAESEAARTPSIQFWESSAALWRAEDEHSNGSTLYAPWRQTPYFWSDFFARSALSFSENGQVWQWAHDDNVWKTTPSQKSWSLVSGSAEQEMWDYYTTPTSTWKKRATPSSVWTQQETEDEWQMSGSDLVWRYSASDGTWQVIIDSEMTTWCYNFSLGSWLDMLGKEIQPDAFPPLPIVQSLFIKNIIASADDYFNDPLRAGARLTRDAYAAPSSSSLRPLSIGSTFDRYNSSSIFLNAPLTLENASFVHTDVSRNLGRVQAPSALPRALPSIVGGDRAFLVPDAEIPTINLVNSSIHCHESLISAGVRFVMTEHPLSPLLGESSNHDNTSSLILYNRGRSHDATHRRGLVFQLGSSANRMADGTESTTLSGAYINIYKSQDWDDVVSALPPAVQFSCSSDKEHSVREKDMAVQTLFMVEGSHIATGWPTYYGATGYTPWSIPLTIDELSPTTLFHPGTGTGGSLLFDGGPWCIGGRVAGGLSVPHPIFAARGSGALYANYGGTVAAGAETDIILDTSLAAAAGHGDRSGVVAVPADQVDLTESGHVQSYAASFSAAAEDDGVYEGNIRVSPNTPYVAMNKTLQSPTLTPVKRPKRNGKPRGK